MRDPENNMSQGPRNRVEMMTPQNVTYCVGMDRN